MGWTLAVFLNSANKLVCQTSMFFQFAAAGLHVEWLRRLFDL
jgi:hypothetical protein